MGMAMNEFFSLQQKIVGRILTGLVFLVIFAGAVMSYERFFIYQDFPVTVEAECDPASESCFVYHCDSEHDECAGNPEEDTRYYKRITKQGNMFPTCENGECPEVSCAETESGCEVEFCDPEGEEECSDSETFLLIDTGTKALVDKPILGSEGGAEEEPIPNEETEGIVSEEH